MRVESRRSFLKSVAALAAGLVLPACVPESAAERGAKKMEQFLKEKGVLGPRPLVDLNSFPGFSMSGEAAGGIFIMIGSIEGESKTIVRFAWEANPQDNNRVVTISELPYDKCQFKVANEQILPTVTFELDPREFVAPAGNYLTTNNLNEYVLWADLAVFSLTQSDLDNLLKPQQ